MAENDMMLDSDISRSTAAVIAHIPWAAHLDEARRNALVNMAFNMGIGNLIKKNPKFLAALERGDYEEAAKEMLDGPWVSQVGMRAERLAEQVRIGEMQ